MPDERQRDTFTLFCERVDLHEKLYSHLPPESFALRCARQLLEGDLDGARYWASRAAETL